MTDEHDAGTEDEQAVLPGMPDPTMPTLKASGTAVIPEKLKRNQRVAMVVVGEVADIDQKRVKGERGTWRWVYTMQVEEAAQVDVDRVAPLLNGEHV